jgi:N-methylhydantoinase A/oxoprolinase/acetone carboxylase beta subunit
MVVAPPVVDVARTVVHVADRMDDAELESEYAALSAEAARALADTRTGTIEYHADARFRGQSHELKVQVTTRTVAEISRQFHAAYRALYGRPPQGRAVEIITLRVRRVGHAPSVRLPRVKPATHAYAGIRVAEITDPAGRPVRASVLRRDELVTMSAMPGPMLIIDPEATTFVPAEWMARTTENGMVTLERE